MNYDNTNTFVLFKNNRKESDKHPDYTGTIELENGKKLKLAAWIREGKKGKFMSGRVSEFQEMQSNHQSGGNDFDSEIPF